MRTITIVGLFVVAMLSGGTGSAKAERYWPWCARYGWSTVCSFATFQQCVASVSGAGGFCQQNVLPPPIGETRVIRARQRRH